MRRPEEVGVQISVGTLHIVHIGRDTVEQTANMIVRVVAEAMAALAHHSELLGVLAHVVAHHEERSLDAVVVEDIEHPRRYLWYGAVVEGEVYGALLSIHTPKGLGIEPSEEYGGLLDDHLYVLFLLGYSP